MTCWIYAFFHVKKLHFSKDHQHHVSNNLDQSEGWKHTKVVSKVAHVESIVIFFEEKNSSVLCFVNLKLSIWK
jgi:hypothetical protein